jgi:hypothetical protein
MAYHVIHYERRVQASEALVAVAAIRLLLHRVGARLFAAHP